MHLIQEVTESGSDWSSLGQHQLHRPSVVVYGDLPVGTATDVQIVGEVVTLTEAL